MNRTFSPIPDEVKAIRVLGLNEVTTESVVDKVYKARTNREALEMAQKEYPGLKKSKAFGPDADKGYTEYKKQLTTAPISLDFEFSKTFSPKSTDQDYDKEISNIESIIKDAEKELPNYRKKFGSKSFQYKRQKWELDRLKIQLKITKAKKLVSQGNQEMKLHMKSFPNQ